ncbi:DUF1906 domain-containing protein [Caldibacillus lycopersici]|uniref:DUF1906 domain-containing protein n=1 Tax=Perspicuibacillus lycopersici TaxID=1325689 RepID=A0AAE3LN83_9BACI|nr:glycoside hydrolase domain-containing protein [Perspicuibacillus lycopersici]MCU9613587.1 DUF1906 domain-containing protein [Perspicuibacillus lycopersici]
MSNLRLRLIIQWVALFLLFLIPIFSIMVIFHSMNNTGNNGGDEKEDKPKEDKPEIIWGVDSASYTNNDLFVCVKDNFGSPEVWGRYLGTKDNVSTGLDKDEIKLLHDENIKILLIYNHFTDATGYDNGVKQAKEAIKLAEELGVPEGKAIFADIEPDYPVNKAFIIGWMEEINNSSYKPGIYGVFTEDRDLYHEYADAAAENDQINKSVIIWTAYPHEGITSKEKAPKFAGVAPEGSKLYGWQYGIDAEKCTIDTNLFKGEILDFLW